MDGMDRVVIREALNEAAQVANALNPLDPPLDLGPEQARLWLAISDIREGVFGPHDNLYPIVGAPVEEPR